MSKHGLFRLLSLGTLTAFVLGAVLNAPALADSGAGSPGGPAAGGQRSKGGAPSSSISRIPSGAKIVVLDAQGNELPLGSQAAQALVSSSDPIWCPSSVASPVAGLSGCSPLVDNGNLYTLTHAVESGAWTPIATNSTIWIMEGPTADSSTLPSVLNGSVIGGTLSNFTLTLQGGWTGSGHTVNTSEPSVLDGLGVNDVVIDIENWHNTVTLSNIEVKRSSGDGIYIYGITKNIVLSDVQALSNGDYGAYLYDAGSGVTITGSAFNDNVVNPVSDDGLEVLSMGPVSLTDTTASGNGRVGAYINTASYGTAGVTLAGTNIFDANASFGLEVYSMGTISSGSLDANGNGSFGAALQNDTAATALPVTLSGTSSFSGNAGNGLAVQSLGAITINNVTAVGNLASGASLANAYGHPSSLNVTGTSTFDANGDYGLWVDSDGAVSLNNITASANSIAGSYDGVYVSNLGASGPQGLKLTGINTFDYNNGGGAQFRSTGAVTLSNVTADYNSTSGADGVLIINDSLGATKPQPVTLSGTNDASLNTESGLVVQTYGAVTISNLTASQNATADGVSLGAGDVVGAVTLSGLNVFDGNKQDGLLASSSGKISLQGLTASYNSGRGAAVGNAYASSAQSVTVIDGTFDANGGAYGLFVYSKGAITATNLQAEFNSAGDGAHLDNCESAPSCANAFIEPVTLSGTNTFNGNYAEGLIVYSRGAITASNLTADSNGHVSAGFGGAYLDNCSYSLSSCTGSAKVTLTGINNFNLNDYNNGLYVYTAGAVAASNLNATGNGGSGGYNGVQIDNSGAPSPMAVTLSGANVFDENGYDGLDVLSRGAITASNLTANNNFNEGVLLNNQHTGSTAGISLTGTNSFISNRASGVGSIDGADLYSYGAESVTHVTAALNGYDGMWFSTPGKVTVTCGAFVDNGIPHGAGFGWQTDGGTGVTPVSITLIGTDYAGNQDGAYFINGSTVASFVPRTCTLP